MPRRVPILPVSWKGGSAVSNVCLMMMRAKQKPMRHNVDEGVFHDDQTTLPSRRPVSPSRRTLTLLFLLANYILHHDDSLVQANEKHIFHLPELSSVKFKFSTYSIPLL